MSFFDLERQANYQQGRTQSPELPNANRSIAETSQNANAHDYQIFFERVSSSIYQVTNNLAEIQQLIHALGTREVVRAKEKLQKLLLATGNLIKVVNSDIKKLSEYNLDKISSNDAVIKRKRKIEQQKISKDFGEVLSQWNYLQKLATEKGREALDRLRAQEHLIEIEEDHEQQPLLSQQRMQLQHVNQDIEFQNQIIDERESEIRQIEQGVTELNEIFRDLGTIINEQQTLLDTVEDNVTNASIGVRKGAEELSQANKYQKEARTSMCYLLLILACIFAFIVLIVLVS